MAMIRRTVILAGALAGGLATSQAPEYAQQYRQRIGGAVDEMRTVIADFDKDATNNGLSRGEALETYARSAEQFLKDRGFSMEAAINRLDRLLDQQSFMEELGPLGRPLAIFRAPDSKIATRAWEDFEPAVPVTSHGLVWGGLGVMLGWWFMRMVVWPFSRRNNKKTNQVEKRPLTLAEAIAEAQKHRGS